jgi:hypothetical protein
MPPAGEGDTLAVGRPEAQRGARTAASPLPPRPARRPAADAQSVKTSANVPAVSQGIDAGKKIAGRKRHIGVDTLGLLLAVWVTAASVSDNIGGMHLMSHVQPPRTCQQYMWPRFELGQTSRTAWPGRRAGRTACNFARARVRVRAVAGSDPAR